MSECYFDTHSDLFQKKYKEDGKRRASISLYSQLPETPEIQHAIEMSQMQSEVHRNRQRREATGILGNVVLVVTLSIHLSLLQVNCRPSLLVKGAPSSLYSQLPDTSEIQFAREMTEMQSEVNTVYRELFF